MLGKIFRPRNLVLGSVGALGVTGGAIAVASHYDPGTKRSLEFWWRIFPIFGHYRFIQLLNRDLKIMDDKVADKKFDELHELYSSRVKDITFSMKGFYLKQAQLLSTQDDLVPAPYMTWVKETQDNVPSNFSGSEAREYMRLKLKEEQNVDFDELFSLWDDTPLGVASVGQVHKAVLRKTGETVAVKLLIPGMEEVFRSDLKTLKSFCSLAMPQHVSAFDEIEKQFGSEFDFREEAKNLDLVRRNCMPRWGDLVEIPTPHLEYCSKHVLVMDYLHGVRLVDGIRKEFTKAAKLTGRSVEDLEAEFKARILGGTFHYKTLEENRTDNQRLKLLLTAKDLLTTNNVWKFLFNNSPAALLYHPYEYHWTEMPMDLGSIVELLCHVHGNQVFEHGAFNGDPHPGNILLLKDGRLGLIDYGQVKKMTVEERIIYAKLILAHSRNDKKEVARLHFDEIKTRTKFRNEEVGYLMSAFYNDRDTDDICEGRNIPEFIDYIEKRDPMIQLSEQYIFVGRVNLMLRGLGKAFGLQMRMSKLWEKEAADFLKSQNVDY